MESARPDRLMTISGVRKAFGTQEVLKNVNL